MKKSENKFLVFGLAGLAATILQCSCSQSTGPEQPNLADKSANVAASQPRSDGKHDHIQLPVQEALAREGGREIGVQKQKSAQTADLTMSAPILAGKTVMGEASARMFLPPQQHFDMESYNNLSENSFILTANDPLSTFSIDVDTASYANIRRMLNQNILPPPGSIRIEEMLNYFQYEYPIEPQQDIGITTEVGPSPWREHAKLVRIGLAARNIPEAELPASNLVFLIDVSGSMAHPNKLPLLQQSMHMLVDSLGQNDRIAIVVYAGCDKVVLQPTSGSQKKTIHAAIDNLGAGGSTNGSSGIKTAYQLAQQHLVTGGNNRIILASDGDFNVGVTSRDELEQLVAAKRESGVFLTVLGFGTGNYHDDTMEVLADKGNGNYAYIDSLLEARKVLIQERGANLFTLARDVKIQIEFNPVQVGAYRLIGYENRILADEDFKDDKKDAGEIGVGHRVTALYEILEPDSDDLPEVAPLKYQKIITSGKSGELLTIKVRFKPQDKAAVAELSQTVADRVIKLSQTSDDFRFAASVAAFGMILGDSEYHGAMNLKQVRELAANSRGIDENGYRAEFVRLVETADILRNYSVNR